MSRPSYSGPCGDCCTCPGVTLLTDGIGSSKSKCGFLAYESGSYTGWFLNETIGDGTETIPFSGSGIECAGSSIQYTYLNYTLDSGGACVGSYTSSCGGGGYYNSSNSDETFICNSSWTINPDCSVTGTQTNTDGTFDCGDYPLPTCGDCAFQCGGTSYSTDDYSNEYTDTMLMSYAVAALPTSFPNAYSGTISYASNQTSGPASQSLSLTTFQYKFRFQPPGGLCYKIDWDEITYDASFDGTEISSSHMSWTWDGDATGYDPSDNTTWPESDIYVISVPTVAPRFVFVENVTPSCVGCSS